MPLLRGIRGTHRRLYTGLAVLAILALIVCFYYYYVSNRERKIQERKFRVLHRIEENFERRIGDYRELIISNLRACEACKDARGSLDLDTLPAVLQQELFRYERDSLTHESDWEITGKGKNSRIYFYISNEELPQHSAGNFHLKISADVEQILTGVLRNDVFSSYILGSREGIAYNNCRDICEVAPTDSLLRNDHVGELLIGKGRFLVFSHPFSQGASQGIILSGIISAEDYADEKYSVPRNFLLTVFLLFLVVLLAFPFIKSFLVSVEETLNVSDVLLALLSLFILCYMYVFMHMSTFTDTIDDAQKRDMLRTTGRQIERTFLSELRAMRRQLNYYDRIFSRSGAAAAGQPAGAADSAMLQPSFYRGFSRVYWLDSGGMQIRELRAGMTAFTNPAVNSERDYHDRDYFKSVVNRELWFPDGPDSGKIYLEPVYSRIDGSFRAVMSKPGSPPSAVAAISSEMGSVIHTVMPRDLDYCLVNQKGAILFTSAGSEHIHENLLEECNFNTALSSAMYARTHTFFDGPFLGSERSFYISPVPELPLYLVTFTNKEPAGGIRLQICLFTSLFILAILSLFSLVILFLVVLKGATGNKLVQKPALDLSVLYPASGFLYRDFGGIFFNVLLMGALLTCAYICRDEPILLLSLLLVNAAGTTAAFCYGRLDLKPARRAIFWIVISGTFLLCDILLLYLGAWQAPVAFAGLILYEGLLVWVIRELRKLRPYDQRAGSGRDPEGDRLPRFLVGLQRKLGSRWRIRFYHQFAFMLVTWFALIALLPTVFVYRYFYKQEHEYRIRSAQVDLARKWYDKTVYKREKQPGHAAARPVTYTSGYYGTQFVTNPGCVQVPDNREALFNAFLHPLRFIIKPRDELMHAVYTGTSDSTIRFCKDDGVLTMTYQNLLNQPESQGRNTLSIQSRLPGFPAPSLAPGSLLPLLLYLLAPLLFLVLLFGVINFFLKRFFLFRVLPSKVADDTGQLKEVIADQYAGPPCKLIILGVFSSGKKALIREAIGIIYDRRHADMPDGPEKEQGRAAFIQETYTGFDLSATETAEAYFRDRIFQEGDILVLSHFEHNLADKETNDRKYDIISSVLRMQEAGRPHLIILSNIHPSLFLNNLKAKSGAESFRAEDYINKQDYYNWTGLLSGFDVFIRSYTPPEALPLRPGADDPEQAVYDGSKSRYIFYLAIWNSLDRIEKFVLYDLARDNLVNYRNKAALYSLYTKGLVALIDMPVIIHEEFRTFILTEISKDEVELEKRQGGRSAWTMFRVPFLMIVMLVLLFVFITQQETFNKLMAGAVALAGSLPILLKLLSVSSGKKEG